MATGVLPEASSLSSLLNAPMSAGRVVWIGLRLARRGAVNPVQSVEAIAGQGLGGDHYKTARNSARQVTLIQREHLDAIASFLGRERIEPSLVRRNIVVEGVNLLALKDRRISIGQAQLEWSGPCDPCARMEEALGAGGFNAMRGHGGITARIIRTGRIMVGDPVERASSDPV